MAVSNPIASPYFSVTCETEGVNYKYSTDGSEPSLVSEDLNSSGRFQIVSGSPMTIRIRAYKDGMEPSDIATCTYTPVTVPMALPDGSVLFYDRGSQYGEYRIGEDGYPVRLDKAVDDESGDETQKWRYLICDKSDLEGTKQWGPYGTDDAVSGASAQPVGTGLPNTNVMIAKYVDNDSYWWKFIKEKRDSTSLKWFMPSKDELNIMYGNKDIITSEGGDAFKTNNFYWSSTEESNYSAWFQSFSPNNQDTNSKRTSYSCRLLRRI